MTADARVPGHGRSPTHDGSRPPRHRGHPRLALAVLAAVVVLDQATKWWAWRHVSGALINPGGDQLVGPKVGAWYSAQVPGAMLDVQGAVALVLAMSVLVRVRRRMLAVPATLAVAGWSSNALDRLGLHFWTAPGSVRGAVDFIHLHWGVYNVADVVIVAGTAFLLAALACAGLTARERPRLPAAPELHRPPRGRFARLVTTAAATGLVTAVAVGAVHHDGVTRPEAEGPGPDVTATP
jgi:lipoprotein signal peptidase